MTRPRVSVIVPFRGGATDARRTLAALAGLQTHAGDEVIVVDNTPSGLFPAGDEAGVEVLRATARRSAYHARNVGARRAGNPWLLFTDADCVPPPLLLEHLFAADLDQRCGIVAGEVIGSPGSDARLARWARSRRGLLASHHLHEGPYPAGIAGNLLVRREAWVDLQGFDDEVRSAADVDLCWRAQAQGWRFEYRPEAVIEHRDPTGLGELMRQSVRYGAGRRWLNRRHRSALSPPSLVRPLARSGGGALIWMVTGHFERALFKLVDGIVAAGIWWGYVARQNHAPVGDQQAGDP